MNCNIQEFVDAAGAEGATAWKVFWPQCHTEMAFQKHNAFGKSGFPFSSKEYTTPTFTCSQRCTDNSVVFDSNHSL